MSTTRSLWNPVAGSDTFLHNLYKCLYLVNASKAKIQKKQKQSTLKNVLFPNHSSTRKFHFRQLLPCASVREHGFVKFLQESNQWQFSETESLKKNTTRDDLREWMKQLCSDGSFIHLILSQELEAVILEHFSKTGIQAGNMESCENKLCGYPQTEEVDST